MPSSDVVQRRPGGRTAKVGRSVAEATLDLIRSRTLDFSVADVADAAGVHRSTVYRRWPTRAALIDEALTIHLNRLEIPDSADLNADLGVLVQRVADYFLDPVEQALNLAIASNADVELSEAIRRHWQPVEDRLRGRLQRAIADRQLSAATDVDAFVLMLFGTMLAATMWDNRPLTNARLKAIATALRRAFPP